ncbi:MAG: glucose-phosphate cytidylyltransferase [Actinomycetia bacterium]|nr:glucose-phosphate cytidylyltransferase [Actinomycetes bacterium]
MKCVILAGGRGTRLSEETVLRPKPLVDIGGRPILWHIMKLYAHHGINDFVVCLGYKGDLVKEYFLHYFMHSSDLTVDLTSNVVTYHDSRAEPWRVTLVDTGDATLTGGRVLRASPYLDPDEPFCLTYGDGVADIDITAEVAYHHAHGLQATMAVVRPPARFGTCTVVEGRVTAFEEKAQSREGMINGGFFVCSPKVLDLIDGDLTPWETAPLERLVAEGQLAAWSHAGFWQAMDTLRDRELLDSLWASGQAPWKVWDES